MPSRNHWAKKNHFYGWQRIVIIPVDKNNQQWLRAHNALDNTFAFYWFALIIDLLLPRLFQALFSDCDSAGKKTDKNHCSHRT